MNFFKSEDIRIFPCTYRGLNTTASALISEDNQKYIKSLNIDPESHMLSEYNLTTLANYPAGKNSYIIDKDDTTLDCVIKGYHIRIANLNEYYTWSGSLYLAIKTKAYPLTETVSGEAAYGIEYLFPFGLTGELAKAAEAATTPLSLDYRAENNDSYCSYCYAVGYTGTAKEAGANGCYYLQITDDDGDIVAKNLVTNIVEFYKDDDINILNGSTKIVGDITIEKTANATGSLTAKGALAVIGETALQNKLTVKPSAEGTTELTVQPDKVKITGELATTKSTIGAGGLVATGTIQAKGGLTVANGKATSLGGTLNITGEITANNGIKVNQGTTSLQATGINGKLEVTGDISAATISINSNALEVNSAGKTTVKEVTINKGTANLSQVTVGAVNSDVTALEVKKGIAKFKAFSADSGAIGDSLSVTGTITADTITGDTINGATIIGAIIKTGDEEGDTIINSTTVKSQEADFGAAKITTAEVTSLTVKDGATISYDAANNATTFNKPVTFNEQVTATNLTVTGKLNCDLPSGEDQHAITGDTNITGDTTVNGKLKVLEDGLEVKGGAIVDSLAVGSTTPTAKSGEIIAQELNICSGGLKVDAAGKTTINDLTVSESLKLSAGKTLAVDTIQASKSNGNVFVNSAFKAGTTTLKKLSIRNFNGKPAQQSDSLTVTGRNNDTEAGLGSVIIREPLTVKAANTVVNNSDGSTVLQVDAAGKTTVNDLIATAATINDGTANLSKITVKAASETDTALTVELGKAEFKAFSADSGTIGGSINVTDTITSKSLTITDGTTINNTLSAGTTTLKTLTVNESASITGALTVNGNANITGAFSLKSTAIEQVIFDLANPVGTVFTTIKDLDPDAYFESLGITSYCKYLGEESVGETIICFWQRVATEAEKGDTSVEVTPEEPTQE